MNRRRSPLDGGLARDGGFALIETVCVLLLSALVIATLSLATSVVVRHSEAAKTKNNQMEVLAAGVARLKRDVSGMIAVRTGPERDSPLLFSGSGSSIVYAVAADSQMPEMMVWIESHYESGIGTLLRWETPLVPGDPARASLHRRKPAILMSGPWVFRFAYAHDGADERSLWDAGWSGRRAMPSLLRLDVADARTRGLVTSMVAATHVDAIFDCVTPEGTCSSEEISQPPYGGENAR